MSDFGLKLGGLADKSAYPELRDVAARWGQLLREDPAIRDVLQEGLRSGKLTTFRVTRTERCSKPGKCLFHRTGTSLRSNPDTVQGDAKGSRTLRCRNGWNPDTF